MYQTDIKKKEFIPQKQTSNWVGEKKILFSCVSPRRVFLCFKFPFFVFIINFNK
jgi:hypothetical protein